MTAKEPKTAHKPRRTARKSTTEKPNDASAMEVDVFDADINPADVFQRKTKISIVLDLLRRQQGALLADIVAATGWQPHTARAALTGLKKKEHTITSTKVDKVTCYKLA